MSLIQKRPYVAVVREGGAKGPPDPLMSGILDSLEEEGIPSRILDPAEDGDVGAQGQGGSEETETPLGIAVFCGREGAGVYYEEYSRSEPVLREQSMDYPAGRLLGKNIARLLQRKGLKETL